jgi:hypothetical protein
MIEVVVASAMQQRHGEMMTNKNMQEKVCIAAAVFIS